MDIDRPHRIISGAYDLDILRVLAGSRAPMTGRHVRRLAGVSHGTSRRVLGRLADAWGAQLDVFSDRIGRMSGNLLRPSAR